MLDALKRELAVILAEHGVLAAYLFGSQIEGTEDALSDLDLGVVLGPKTLSLDQLLLLQDDLQRQIGSTRLDLVLLEKAEAPLAFAAISRGELLYSSSKVSQTDFEEKVLREYQDFAPFLQRFHSDVAEAVRAGGSHD